MHGNHQELDLTIKFEAAMHYLGYLVMAHHHGDIRIQKSEFEQFIATMDHSTEVSQNEHEVVIRVKTYPKARKWN